MTDYRDDRPMMTSRLEAAVGRLRAALSAAEKKRAELGEVADVRRLGALPAVGEAVAPDFLRGLDRIAVDDLRLLGDHIEEEAGKTERATASLEELRKSFAATDRGLGAPPRAVPGSYLAVEWLGVFHRVAFVGLFLWPLLLLPFAFAEPTLLYLGVLSVVASVRTLRRRRLLRFARVARVRLIGHKESTSRYRGSGPARATGWIIDTDGGRARTSTVKITTDDGRASKIVGGGRGYADGIILYDSSRLDEVVASPIERLGCQPHPDVDGGWAPSIPGTAVLHIVTGSLLIASILAGLAVTVLQGRFLLSYL